MADENTPDKPVIVNYGSNSHKSKEQAEANTRRTPNSVVSNPVVIAKPSIGRKFKETFAGDDAQTVGQYILFDVIVPRTKDLIADMVSQGIERLLFGSSTPRGRGTGSVLVGNRTSYNKMYSGTSRSTTVSSNRDISQQSRATHDFREVLMETRVEAESVLDSLTDLIEEYGSATVSDFYACVGVSNEWTDNKYGWTSLVGTRVRQTRDGYLIDLPRPTVLS